MSSPRGVRERGGVFEWNVSVNNQRRTGTADTLEQAEIDRLTAKQELRGQKIRKLPRRKVAAWSLGKAFDYTMRMVWAGVRSEKTQHINGTAFVSYFGRSRPAHTLTTEDFDLWVEHLKSIGNSNGTINRKLTAASKILTTGEDTNGIIWPQETGRPKIRRLDEPEGRLRWFTKAEENLIVGKFRYFEKHLYADASVTMIDSGLRTGELRRTEVRDFCFRTDNINVAAAVSKNKVSGSIPMTSRVRVILKARCAGLAPTDRPFDFTKDQYRHAWNRVRVSLGYANDEQFVPHVLRHTFGSRLVQKGVHLLRVKELMRHKDITQTMRYAHLAPRHLDTAMAVLEDFEDDE